MDASPRRFLIPLVAALLGGCGTTYYDLAPEMEIPHLAALRDASAALPCRTTFVEAGSPGETPFRVAVEEIGAGESDRLVVLVHGVLSNRRVWRFMAGDLGRDHDLLLIDLPGCGDSDKPDPGIVGEEFYSPVSLAKAVLETLRNTMRNTRQQRPRNITLIGHSLGGMVILRMLGTPQFQTRYADVLDRVDNAILLAPVDAAVEKKYPVFEQIAELTDLEAGLGKLLGILSREVAQATYESAADPSRIPREETDRLLGILSDSTTRHVAQAMIRQTIPFGADGRPDWQKIGPLEAQYKNIHVPCLILWGRWDETLPVSMGYKLAQQLPLSWLRILPESMHALPCERPVRCAEVIRGFLGTAGVGWSEAVLEIGPPSNDLPKVAGNETAQTVSAVGNHGR